MWNWLITMHMRLWLTQLGSPALLCQTLPKCKNCPTPFQTHSSHTVSVPQNLKWNMKCPTAFCPSAQCHLSFWGPLQSPSPFKAMTHSLFHTTHTGLPPKLSSNPGLNSCHFHWIACPEPGWTSFNTFDIYILNDRALCRPTALWGLGAAGAARGGRSGPGWQDPSHQPSQEQGGGAQGHRGSPSPGNQVLPGGWAEARQACQGSGSGPVRETRASHNPGLARKGFFRKVRFAYAHSAASHRHIRWYCI